MTRQAARRDYDAKRRADKPWRKWYHTKRWGRIKAAILARDPVCKLCNTAQSTICDHVQRHGGDPLRFWGGPFQGLCKRCHDSTKQAMERPKKRIATDGWPVTPANSSWWQTKEQLFLPPNLRPSRPALTIVCGPPGVGKTKFINEHRQPTDIVIDSDLEAKRLGLSPYTKRWAERVQILRARNDRLRTLAQSTAAYAWFSATLAKPEHRAHFAEALLPEAVVVLLESPEICARRIRQTRPNAAPELLHSPFRWHTHYTPRSGEIVVCDADKGMGGVQMGL